MRPLFLPLIACALTGCAKMHYVSQEYGVWTRPVAYTSPSQKVWIFDKPDKGKMMVCLAPLNAFGHGYAHGMTLGLAHVMDLEADMKQSAESYLASTGRKGRATSARELLRAQWEVTYELQR